MNATLEQLELTRPGEPRSRIGDRLSETDRRGLAVELREQMERIRAQVARLDAAGRSSPPWTGGGPRGLGFGGLEFR